MAEPVRVLHVLHSMNCGGAETLIMNIYRNIDRERVQFDFLVNVFDKMFFEDEILKSGGRIFRIPFLTKLTPPVYERRLYEFFREHGEIKTVHSHLETTTGIILKQARRAGVTVRIAHSHNSRYTRTGLRYAPENIYKSYCRQKIVPNATELFGCSELANCWLFGNEGKNAKIIRNGIETEKYAFSEAVRKEVRGELGIKDGTKAVGHVGRFNDQKNHLFLIDIFQKFSELNDDSLLLLAGEGVLMEQVREKAKRLGLLDRIRFLGLRCDVNRLMQAFDVFVLPSKFEGLPLVIVEAQAAGLPCVVPDAISRMSYLGCSRFTFLPLGDAQAWADAICNAGGRSPCAASAVAEAGYDIRATAKMLEDLYIKGENNA